VRSTRLARNLVHNNSCSGNEQVRAFKKIIEESVYPEHPEYSSVAGMAIAVRIFDAYKKSGGNQEGLIDLMLFFVECGSQFTIDYGDIDEDFYTVLEDVFEEVLVLIKKSNIEIFERYRERLYCIAEETREIGWGYGDQIRDLLIMNFPDFFKK